jgi:predicted nucleic acid-binding protein
MKPSEVIAYWDTSAVVSLLFQDEYTQRAKRTARLRGIHLISSLAWTETHAVIARLEREHAAAGDVLNAVRVALHGSPWRPTNVTPSWELVESLSQKWPLRGADLWHLAAAKTLQEELPELRLLSYDVRLTAAANGEGLRFPH